LVNSLNKLFYMEEIDELKIKITKLKYQKKILLLYVVISIIIMIYNNF
jgi:hypothetical protein